MRFWVALTLLSFAPSVPALQSPAKGKIHLELGETRVTEDGETVIEAGGKCGPAVGRVPPLPVDAVFK